MKKNIILMICMTLSVMLAVSSCADEERLKLLSFNIRYINDIDTGSLAWDQRREACVRLIEDASPDIIGFQEPKAPQVAYLTESLPQYGHVEMGRDAGIKPDGGEHLMIMYDKRKYELKDNGHFWLSETPDSVSFGWDAMCRRVTVWVRLADVSTGKEFYFFDTHFDHKGKEARRQEAILLAAKMQEIAGENAPVFVCGDFNMDSGHDSMIPVREWMREACLDAPQTDTLSTFNGFGIDTRPLKIDHVFYRNASALTYSVIRDGYGARYVSDHYPVLAVFSLQ